MLSSLPEELTYHRNAFQWQVFLYEICYEQQQQHCVDNHLYNTVFNRVYERCTVYCGEQQCVYEYAFEVIVYCIAFLSHNVGECHCRKVPGIPHPVPRMHQCSSQRESNPMHEAAAPSHGIRSNGHGTGAPVYRRRLRKECL